MKILHIINCLVSGGAEKLMEQLLPVMDKREGITVELLLLTDKGNVYLEGLEKCKIKVGILPTRQLFNPLNVFYIRKHIIEGKYNLVHAHLFPAIYWVSIVSKLIHDKSIKFVMTEHSTHNKRRNLKSFRPVERVIYANYDRVISISEETQKKLIEWLKIGPQKLAKFCVIDNGVDIIRFNQARPYLKSQLNASFSERLKLIGMVARFTESKDHFTVIKALSKLPSNIHLVLVGQGPLLNKTIDFAKAMGVYNRVHFLGFRSDVENILQTIDITVICSRWEGFSLTAVEAMAAGKPIVATNVPGLCEVVGAAGLLFDVGDTERLAKCILEVLTDREYYEKLSKEGMRRADNFSINKMAERYLAAYELLIKTS